LYHFFGGDSNKKETVKEVLKQFELHSGIKFTHTSSDAGANIRISFNADDNTPGWSAIGKTADEIPCGQPTLTLPRSLTKAQVYHLVGHALGLEHEWDGETVLQNARYPELFKHQQVSNFPPLDLDKPVRTIMRYVSHRLLDRAPFSWTTGCRYPIEAGQTELSVFDKAWLTINYPKRNKDHNEVIEQARILKIENSVGAEIANTTTKASVMRRLYTKYTTEKWSEKSKPFFRDWAGPHSDLLRAVKGQTLPELLGALQITQEMNANALDGVAFSALMHPSFHAGVARIVEEQLVKDGLLSEEDIETASPASLDMMVAGAPEAQHWISELSGMLGALLPLVLHAPPAGPGSAQAAHSLDSTAGAPEAQHWIGAVLGILGAVLPVLMNGVPPPPGAAHAADYSGQRLPLQVQQGVFSNLAQLLKHPLLISTVKMVAEQL